MIRAYIRRAWRVGRRYYFATIIALLVAMVNTTAILIGVMRMISPENIHGVNLPPDLAVEFTRETLMFIAIAIMALSTSLLSSVMILGTIQADIQNGVFEVLLGNGVSDTDIARALFVAGVVSMMVFYAIAEVVLLVMVAVAQLISKWVLIAIVLAPLSTGLFTAGLSVFIGLAKPNYFKVSTGIGSTKNLAFTIASLPSMVVLLVTIALILSTVGSADPLTAIRWFEPSLVITSVAMLAITPLFVIRVPTDRVGLISKGE